MRFQIHPAERDHSDRTLFYRKDEYSFAVTPAPTAALTSVLINDLNLDLDEAGKVISVWGLCPHPGWVRSSLKPPKADFSDVIFVPDEPLERGISVRLNRNHRWPVFVDPSSGWICCGHDHPTGAVAARILPDVIFELTENGLMKAIWLHPAKLPSK